MTCRERFIETNTFGSPDRIPNHELGLWGHTVERWHAEGMPLYTLTYDWFDGEEYFGMDRREFIPINVGMIPGFDPEVLEETERHIVVRHANGVVTKALKEGTVLGTRPSMDQYLRFAVETPEDFADMKKRYDPATPIRYPAWWEDRVKAWSVREHPLCLLTNATLGLYSNLRIWMGTENLSMAFYDQPKLVHEMVEFVADFFIAVTQCAVKDVDVDYFNFFEDFAFKTGPLLSPDLFREFLLPHYKRVIAHLKSHGVRFISLDSDGNTEVLMPMFIEAGVDIHWPLEVAADMDAVRLRKEYGQDLVFWGGIDKRELAKGRAEIDAELERRILPLRDKGGYIPTVDHTVPPDVSYDNFCYYMERKQELLA